jgi:hypothetical protein
LAGVAHALTEEGATFAVEDDAEFSDGHEPVALRHLERRAAPSEFAQGQGLIELANFADV